ncbi:MAG: PEP-CTERM sorting domain-containing protein [Limisphaera sp.]
MKRIQRLWALLSCILPLSASAEVFSLSGDFDHNNNPNAGGWSYFNNSSLLPNQVPLNNGNALYPAVLPRFFATGPNLNTDTPMVIKAGVNGSSAGETDADFLQGDILIHSPNSATSVLTVQWTAPEAGSIDFTSDIWYAHSVVNRANAVSIFLNSTLLGSATISRTSYSNRNNPWRVALNDVAVNAGDTLRFQFQKSAGQTVGSLNGVAVTVDFTPIPEPGTGTLLLIGGGLLGLMSRLRSGRP